MSAHVNGDDRLRSRSNRSLGQLGIEAVSVRFDVYQHGQCVRKQDRTDGRNECEIWKNDLSARPEAERSYRDFQSGRTVGYCDPMASAVKACKRLLKFQSFGSRRAPPDSAFQDFVQSLPFRIVELRP